MLARVVEVAVLVEVDPSRQPTVGRSGCGVGSDAAPREDGRSVGNAVVQSVKVRESQALLADVLRALARIAKSCPGLIRKATFRFIPLLQDPDPQVRAYAVMLLAHLKASEAKEDLRGLTEDKSRITLYHEGGLQETSISELASEALAKI